MSLIDFVECATEKIASDPNETRQEYIARMALEGCVPSYPEANELQIDIDNSGHYEAFQRSAAILSREFPDVTYAETTSKGGGKHIRIKLPFEVSVIERIAWQGALRSDPVRELLSCLRYHNNDEQPTLFIEKSEK